MLDILFKDWLEFFEAAGDEDIRGTVDRFQIYVDTYIKPFAKALLNYSKKNSSFLDENDKLQINRVLDEDYDPAILAMRAGGSSVAAYTPFVSADFVYALHGFEARKKVTKATGWINNTWNKYVKDGSKFLFKNFKSFKLYLKNIKSQSKANYEINTFDQLMYWLVLRLKINLGSYVRSSKSAIRGEIEDANQIITSKAPSSLSEMPLKIQDCFTKYFTDKAAQLEPKIKNYIANMNSTSFLNLSGNDAARIYLWFYLTCKHISENPDVLYPTVEKLYKTLVDLMVDKTGAKQSQFIRNFLHSFDAHKTAPVRQHIVSVLKSGDEFSRLGLGSIAVSIYRNFVRCADSPEPSEEIIASMPNLAGIKDYLNSVKDIINCRRKTEKVPIHTDKPTATSGEQEKVDYLISHFFLLSYPTWKFAQEQREELADELWRELTACLHLVQEDEFE